MINPSLGDLLTMAQAAEHLNVQVPMLACWASSQRYQLPFTRVGRAVRYRRPDLERVLASRTVNGYAKYFHASQRKGNTDDTWSCDSDSDGGGGACLISADEAFWFCAHDWLEQQVKNFYRRQRNKRK